MRQIKKLSAGKLHSRVFATEGFGTSSHNAFVSHV